MPAWTIISPNNPETNSRGQNDHRHPMRMNIYWVMKAVYHMLDPSNEPSSTTDEVKHIATLEYTVSQENAGSPDVSSLVIHLRLSTETDTHFDVMLRDMQIEDKVENVCVSLPGELTPVLMDISEFVREFVLRRSAIKREPGASDCSFGGWIWQKMQAEKYRQRVSQQEVVGVKKTGRCPLCRHGLIDCKSCHVASCRSLGCHGSSKPPLARCAEHPKNTLCSPCLEEQGSKRELEKCPGCKSWCCATDINSCIGHPVAIPLVPCSSTEHLLHVMTTYSQSARVHPPKGGSCNQCEQPGWRRCRGNGCWSGDDVICPECASGGTTCMCQKVWACDICAEHDSSIFIRCPRCDRPFCTSCTYIDQCKQCFRVTLCYDCVEEASDADDTDDGVVETFAKLTGTCESCGVRVCNRCAPIEPSWLSCSECLAMKIRRRARLHA
ncbi:hypothetical protein DFJ58DRAFT_472057 [Suillus subalutaceus]|uniref:uncharacterized protein n=1 Tax=Suillus subalutaceus TaxID=48586 RepID=UPI001B87111D|nr:uncharacterized protein DFJ58DRAFT_472057 [Suillus subalutaceus]KAG1848295.1 hypothetical protein DFJ58DRAFT_472057 [Suillus subalutaceus]